MMYFEVGGKRYRVKSAEEMTLGDWRDLTQVKLDPMDNEAGVELVRRHTKIPKKLLRKLRPADADKVFTALGAMLAEARLMKANDDYQLPTEYELDGVTYTVPQDLETDTVSGQWWDLESVSKTEHEADAMAQCLSVLLVPKGKEYDGVDRSADFMKMPMSDAFGMSAFFFGKSERFKNATHRSLSLLVSYVRLRPKADQHGSPSGTETSPSSTDLPRTLT